MSEAKAAKKPNPALMKPLQPSAELAAVVGSSPLPRTEVVSKVWEYIKTNNLQNSKSASAPRRLRGLWARSQSELLGSRKREVNASHPFHAHCAQQGWTQAGLSQG
jgi:hypothetical protein